MTVNMAKMGNILTVIQQPQDLDGLRLGYLRRLNLTPNDVMELLEWMKINHPSECYDVFYKDLPNLKIKSCEECADCNWDGG